MMSTFIASNTCFKTRFSARTKGSSDGIMMIDGETYFTIVKATNLLGLTMIQMSDGVTVQREPLVPGYVNDGDLTGRDVNYQLSTDSISANWGGFRRKRR